MVDIQSKESIDKISDELKIQPSLMIPRELGKNIQLTYDIGPRFIATEQAFSGAVTGSGTISGFFATPANQDFFLISLTGGFSKDAACDISTGMMNITGVIRGRIVNLLQFAIITLTAERDKVVIAFNPPIKLDRNTSIVMQGQFTLGVMSRELSLTGYITDPQ